MEITELKAAASVPWTKITLIMGKAGAMGNVPGKTENAPNENVTNLHRNSNFAFKFCLTYFMHLKKNSKP